MFVSIHKHISALNINNSHKTVFFFTCIFYMDHWCTYPPVGLYLVDIKFEPYFFSRLIHVAFPMWIVVEHFQVYST